MTGPIITALELEKVDAGYRALLYECDANHRPVSILAIIEADDPMLVMETVCEGHSPPTYAKKGDKLDHGDALSVQEVCELMAEGGGLE